MIEVSSVKELKEAGFNKIAVACGNFDGLHRGHQEMGGNGDRRREETRPGKNTKGEKEEELQD